MSFSSDIKKELCAINEKNPCCRRSELAAILLFGGSFGSDVTLRAERADVFRRICGLLKKVLGMTEIQEEPDIRVPADLLDELGLYPEGADVSIDEEVFDKDCCKRAFFRGAFLMAGTAADPRKNYRLELFAYNETVASLASEMLESFGLSPGNVRRKNYYVIYLEDYESVSDSLVIMGAQKSMLNLSYIQIEKDISNENNRRNNFMIANMDKAMTVSANQCAAIDELARTGMLETLDEGLKAVAYARAEHPEMSLNELAQLTGVSKSTLSRRLNKLLELGNPQSGGKE